MGDLGKLLRGGVLPPIVDTPLEDVGDALVQQGVLTREELGGAHLLQQRVAEAVAATIIWASMPLRGPRAHWENSQSFATREAGSLSPPLLTRHPPTGWQA
jgi:hypothetical protein